ncbi:hypothetical protein P5673_012742 [Acropora cervicornis]|uniref:Uncharacterized protein n=1 Tax=Acropora cervicornis TaxID=6130 RepID=A0AAD9QMA5_ACRCE|nr:hypothetical protein P5673_012742 [Acropora cervicornis]
MVSSNKLVLLCLIFGLLLSTLSRPAGGQLLGIRWGRNYQDNDVNREVHKPKLWESMTERRFSPEIVQGREAGRVLKKLLHERQRDKLDNQ